MDTKQTFSDDEIAILTHRQRLALLEPSAVQVVADRMAVTRCRVYQLRKKAVAMIEKYRQREKYPFWDCPPIIQINLALVIKENSPEQLCNLAKNKYEVMKRRNFGKTSYKYLLEYCQRKWPELMKPPEPTPLPDAPTGSVLEFARSTELSVRAYNTLMNAYHDAGKSMLDLFSDAKDFRLFTIRNCGKKTQHEIRAALGITPL